MSGRYGACCELQVQHKRCMWCAFPLHHCEDAFEIDIEPFQGSWCTPNCAVSYFRTFRKELGVRYVRAVQEYTHTPLDVEWTCAPEPQPYEWWAPGGLSREEFLLNCRVVTVRRVIPGEKPVFRITQNYGLKDLFNTVNPRREDPPKKRKLDDKTKNPP